MKETINIQKNRLQLFLIMTVLIAAANIFAGNKEFPQALQMVYSNNSDVNNPQYTTVQPPETKKGPMEIELEKKIDVARSSNNVFMYKQLQEKLDELRGHVQVIEPDMHFSYRFFNGNENEYDHIQSVIHGSLIRSHAFAIEPAGAPSQGRLFYIFIQNSQPNADTLKIMQSNNNGATWFPYIKLSTNGYIHNKDELDAEMVYDGTNAWLFLTSGVTDISNNSKKIYFLRVNITASGISGTYLSFPGSGTGMNYYNPRLTSDNANYTSASHVMMICSMDSLAGSVHYVKQKYVLLNFPFAAQLAFNYAQPNGTNGFGWGGNNGTNANTYLYGDIAYYKDEGGTGENRVMTVYGNYGSGINNIYLAYVSNYSTFGAALYIPETNLNKEVKIAFNGGSNNRNGMITYVKYISSANWDIYGFKTTNGGIPAAAWSPVVIDNTPERTRTCDLAAVRNAASQFKICYGQDSAGGPAAFYRSYNGSTWSTRYRYNTSTSDTTFGKPKAGYMLGGGDDGIGFWSSYGGFGGYSSRLIITTTGIVKNNEVPSVYSLSQNYPNPFNPVTNIKFSISESGLVKLTVYDITGKEIAVLVNQNLNSGVYTVDFDASHLSSGAYFYRLSTARFTDIRKMILIK